jgi:hypothetical protein
MIQHYFLLLIVICLALPVPALSSDVYVWRNDKGELVFSDTPQAGSEVVIVEETTKKKSKNGTVDTKNDIPHLHMETSLLDINPSEVSNDYEVVINHPKNNATIRDNTGAIIIRGGVKPIFKRGYRVQLYVDNKPYKEPQTHSIYSLHEIDRGEHQIKIVLIDESGAEVSSSKTITFYMHRSSTY